jgi:hypothetical protein
MLLHHFRVASHFATADGTGAEGCRLLYSETRQFALARRIFDAQFDEVFGGLHY